MMCKHHISPFLPLLMMVVFAAIPVGAQVEVRSQAQVSVSSGDHTPLWLNANKYGLSSLDKTNSYVRAGAFRSISHDSLRRWAWGGALDMAVAAGFTSTIVVQQAYGELRWKKGLVTVGSKEQPMELKNQELSSGSQTLGVNARPVPSVRLSLPQYWDVPGFGGWLGIKGHIAYGMSTDDRWQKHFTHRQSKYAEHTRLHTKAGYLRIGKADKPLTAEVGMEMACQYGGTSYHENIDGMMEIKNEGGLKGMWHALVPSGKGEYDKLDYHNSDGNHLGSYVMRLNLDYEKWGASVYADHFFEDQSSMFFLDYDGYGTGAEWNDKKDTRFFLYDMRDIMLGAELRIKQCRWFSDVMVEYIYTKYQSGPIYHDHTMSISDHISGVDDYYNHGLMPGWQHWGQVMGNALYRSPLYNSDGVINCDDNRFWAWHVGMAGSPAEGLHYRLLASMQKGWGTYMRPLLAPARNFSLMAEAGYHFPGGGSLSGWSVRCSAGLDSGELLGDNYGVQVTIGKQIMLRKR